MVALHRFNCTCSRFLQKCYFVPGWCEIVRGRKIWSDGQAAILHRRLPGSCKVQQEAVDLDTPHANCWILIHWTQNPFSADNWQMLQNISLTIRCRWATTVVQELFQNSLVLLRHAILAPLLNYQSISVLNCADDSSCICKLDLRACDLQSYCWWVYTLFYLEINIG